MSNENTALPEFPKIKFSGLDLKKSQGSETWNKTREQVMKIIKTHGFFQVVLDEISPEVADQLFGYAFKEAFDLPLEAKRRNDYQKPYHRYTVATGIANHESLHIEAAYTLESIEQFTRFLWPDGNPKFRDILWNCVKPMFDVELIIRKMIVEGLGLKDEHFESLSEKLERNARLMNYGTPVRESRIGMRSHLDSNFVTFVYQRDEGLELQTHADGVWLSAPAGALVISFSEGLQVWSNDRIQPTFHRIRVPNDSRYSFGIGAAFKDDEWIKCPEELIDEDHPEKFKPFEYTSYLKFRFVDPAYDADDSLKAYCGTTTVTN